MLTFLKKKKKIRQLKVILIFLSLKKNKILDFGSNNEKILGQIQKKRTQNKNLFKHCIHYIVNVNLTYTNTFINITDIKGNVKICYSGGSVKLKSKQKIKQPTAILTLLKQLIINAKFLTNNSLAIHFKNTRTNYESYIIKLLIQKFYVKSVKSYNFQPHNGCRPKKIKRLKKKYIKFVLEKWLSG
uniref:ribosomal protein S11 n=1 Tax=Odontella aurita TaxID=265563 RepID=UPI0020287F18|nr:ribosomal protein S11 [Odontella aurita]QYB22935.1 ribosomal protein S11 [Odontella aurita]